MSSTFEHLASALKAREQITVSWNSAECLPGSGETESPAVVVLWRTGMGATLDADAARLLGLALIEASGLALGAWGANNALREDEDAAVTALENEMRASR
jgi:hypothetical protein